MPLFRFDAGWLYLVAGSALIVATVLIPAVNDLAEARWHRDRCLALERYRSDRLKNYTDYLDALSERSPTLVLSLAATNLNLAPADKVPLEQSYEARSSDAGVFRDLDPTLRLPPAPKAPETYLQKWATDEEKRMWVISLGALSVLFGLLPASEPGRTNTGRMVDMGRGVVGLFAALIRRREKAEAAPVPEVTPPGKMPSPAPEKKPHRLRLVGSAA